MLATESTSRIVAHERPDLIEVGSAWCAPWLIRLATRRIDVPTVWFYHSNFPRIIAPRPRSAGWVRRSASAAAWRYVRRLGRPGPHHHRAIRDRGPGAPGSRAGERGLRPAGRGPGALQSRPGGATPPRPGGASVSPRAGWPCTSDESPGRRTWMCCCRGWPRVERRTGARLVIVGDGPARPLSLRGAGRRPGHLAAVPARSRSAGRSVRRGRPGRGAGPGRDVRARLGRSAGQRELRCSRSTRVACRRNGDPLRGRHAVRIGRCRSPGGSSGAAARRGPSSLGIAGAPLCRVAPRLEHGVRSSLLGIPQRAFARESARRRMSSASVW